MSRQVIAADRHLHNEISFATCFQCWQAKAHIRAKTTFRYFSFRSRVFCFLILHNDIGNQSISKAEVERDAYLFGDPTETASVEGGGDGESSIIYKHKTFVDMGVCPQLAIALKKTQKTIPTLIQKASFDSIVSKKDVVICAETGSGKTLSYLLPLLEQYYTGPKERSSLKYPTAVVLVPNKDLMGQVQRMAEEVIKHANRVPVTAEGEMAARVFCGCVERVDGHWPYEGLEEEPLTHSPDILICTPAFLGE